MTDCYWPGFNWLPLSFPLPSVYLLHDACNWKSKREITFEKNQTWPKPEAFTQQNSWNQKGPRKGSGNRTLREPHLSQFPSAALFTGWNLPKLSQNTHVFFLAFTMLQCLDIVRYFIGIYQKTKLHWYYPLIKGILHPECLLDQLLDSAWNDTQNVCTGNPSLETHVFSFLHRSFFFNNREKKKKAATQVFSVFGPGGRNA